MSRTFVCIHGAWHGGWLWRRSAELLRRAGYEVFTPSLTGLGDRSHLLSPDINLTTHVNDIVNVIESHEIHDVVLCGHSYGGLVAGLVADRLPRLISGLVFVDAFMPEDGKSVIDLCDGHPIQDAIVTSAREHGDGHYVPAPDAEQFGMLDEVDTTWLNRQLSAHPLASFTEPAQLCGDWRLNRRLAYVAATGLDAPMQRLRDTAIATENCEYHELPCGHNIMLDMPEALHSIIVAADHAGA